MKVIRVDSEFLQFDNGTVLASDHRQSCCEEHYLCFNNLSLTDFEGLLFDLSNDNFFERIPGYGIALKPINGFYSENLSLTLNGENFQVQFDISDCQEISG